MSTPASGRYPHTRDTREHGRRLHAVTTFDRGEAMWTMGRKRWVCTVLVAGSSLFAVGCRQQTTFINGNDVAVRKDPNAPSCNDVEQHGRSIVLTGSRLSAPPATGGRIENGTYVLTSSILYTRERPHGAALLNIGRTTMVIIGEIAQLIRTDADERERRTTVKRITNGTTTTLETVCSSGSQKRTESTSTSYTATPTGFQFITPSPAGMVVATYTRVEDEGKPPKSTNDSPKP